MPQSDHDSLGGHASARDAHAHRGGADFAAEPERDSLTADELRARVLETFAPRAPVTVPLAAAAGLVLAEPLRAQVDVPAFDNSAMDGYAVRAADLASAESRHPLTLEVVDDIAAGDRRELALAPGTAMSIMTGAPVPRGADAIVPVEHTDGGRERVTVTTAPTELAHIRHAGDDLHIGDTVLEAGTVLHARALSSAASTGHGRVVAHPAPRVAVIATGSELVAPGEDLGRGQITDSNSTLLAESVREAGGRVAWSGRVGDDADALTDLLDSLVDGGARSAPVDMMVLTGGVSVGAYDVVKDVLAPTGTVRFSAVRMQPGKPQAFGTYRGVPIFGLPGNPVSAFVSFEAFVRPALLTLRGLATVERARFSAVAAAPWRCPVGREQFIPVVIDEKKDAATSPRVRPAAQRGSASHLVASLARADALAIVPADVERVRVGDTVSVMLVS